MSWALILSAAALTYTLRAAPLLAPGELPDGARAALERLPAPLFAALAAAAVVDTEAAVAPTVWLAAGGALAAVVVRPSLPAAFLGGAAGFGLALAAGL